MRRKVWPSILVLALALSGWLGPSLAEGAASGTIQPSTADSWLNGGSVSWDTNFDDWGIVRVTNKQPTTRAVVRFDLPSDWAIKTATLSLWKTFGPESRTYSAHRITNDWVENQVTWNSRVTGTLWGTAGGDFNAGATATAGTGTSTGVWINWVITNDVNLWQTGTNNYGTLIRDGNEGSGAGGKITEFASNHSSVSATNKPKLAVTYLGKVTSLTATASTGQNALTWVLPGGSPDYNGTLIIRRAGSAPTSTPTDGTVYTAGSSTLADGSLVVFNNTALATSFTDTGLTDGTTYYYQAFSRDGGNLYSFASATVSAIWCSAVADATYVAASATSTGATVYWSSANPVLIVRKSGGSTDPPVGGTTYSAGNPIGSSTVVYSGSVAATSVLDTVAGRTTTDRYKVFPKAGSCYAPGVQVDASVPSGTAWSYAHYSPSGGSMLKPGIAGTGTIYPSSMSSRIISLSTADGTRSWDPISSTGAIQGWLTWLPGSAGASSGVKLLQTGEVTMDATPKTVGITQVDPAKSFVVCSNRVGGGAGSAPDKRATCELSSTAVTITTSLAEATNVVRWYVVEFKGGVYVERGTATFGTSDTTPNPAVPALTGSGGSGFDLTKSFVLISERMNSTSTTVDEQWTVRARLTTATNLELTRNVSGTATTVAWQVIQMEGASVQRGTLCIGSTSQCPGSTDISINGSERQNTATLSTGVDTSKSFILITRKGGTLVAGWESKYQVRAKFSSTGTSVTGLTFIRGHQEATDNHQVDIAYEVVSLSDGSTVQGGDALSLATGSSLNAPISAIDTSRTVPFFSASVEYTTQTNNLDETSWTGKFDTTTNLLLERVGTGLISRVAWFVVQFPAPVSGPAVFGGDQSGFLYSVDANIGATNWGGTALTGADAVQAGVSAQVRVWSNAAFQAAYTDDVIFAATWNAVATSNKVFALKASDGTSAGWTFQDAVNGVDYIAGQPYVDYARNRIYVVSRAGSGSNQQSLWVIKTVDGEGVLKGQPMACPACTNLPPTGLKGVHFETSPTLSYNGNTLYIGDTVGKLYAINAGALTLKWMLDLGAAAKINTSGFVWEDYTTAGRLYFVTADGNVRCVQDNGSSAAACTGWTVTNVPGAATPLLLDKLFVGANDGTVRQINLTTGTEDKRFPAAGSLDGTPLGAISSETGNEIFVGTNGGKIFKINLTSGALP